MCVQEGGTIRVQYVGHGIHTQPAAHFCMMLVCTAIGCILLFFTICDRCRPPCYKMLGM